MPTNGTKVNLWYELHHSYVISTFQPHPSHHCIGKNPNQLPLIHITLKLPTYQIGKRTITQQLALPGFDFLLLNRTATTF